MSDAKYEPAPFGSVQYLRNWASRKRKQASQAEQLAAVASGIGEYGISNANYRLEGILRKQAADIMAQAEAKLRAEDANASEQMPCQMHDMSAVCTCLPKLTRNPEPCAATEAYGATGCT